MSNTEASVPDEPSKAKHATKERRDIMTETTENRLIQTKLLNSQVLSMLDDWVIDYGYTDSLGNDCALLICKKAEL